MYSQAIERGFFYTFTIGNLCKHSSVLATEQYPRNLDFIKNIELLELRGGKWLHEALCVKKLRGFHSTWTVTCASGTLRKSSEAKVAVQL